MAQQVELPDLGQMAIDMDDISRSHKSLAGNIAKMQNVPAFNPGAQILQESRALRREMRQGFGNMERRLDAMWEFAGFS